MNLSKFGALIKVTEGTGQGAWWRFRATNVDGRLRVRVVTGAGVLRYQNNDTTRTRRHPRPFRPYSQEHARVLRVRAHPRAGAGATRTRLLPCTLGKDLYGQSEDGSCLGMLQGSVEHLIHVGEGTF